MVSTMNYQMIKEIKWILNMILKKLFLKGHEEELTDKEESLDLSDMSSLGGDEEEVKEGKG